MGWIQYVNDEIQLSETKNNISLWKINMASELGWRKVIKITLIKTPLVETREYGGELKEYLGLKYTLGNLVIMVWWI